MSDTTYLGVTAFLLVVLLIASFMLDDNKKTFIKDFKEAGGIPVTTSRSNVCLSVNAVIRLEQ